MKEIELYIKKGDIKKAMQLLYEQNSGLSQDDIIHLESRFNELKNFYNSGIITLAEYNLEKNRITKSLLELINTNYNRSGISSLRKFNFDVFLIKNWKLIAIFTLYLLILLILHSPYNILYLDDGIDFESSHLSFLNALIPNEIRVLYIISSLIFLLILVGRIWSLILFTILQLLISFIIINKLSIEVFPYEYYKINWGIYFNLILWTTMMNLTIIQIIEISKVKK